MPDKKLPVLDPTYWDNRFDNAPRELQHYSVYRCTASDLIHINARHKKQIAEVLTPMSSVLDVGCGYGRLLTLVPEWWHGEYVGIDLGNEFIRQASTDYPERMFIRGDLLTTNVMRSRLYKRFDWSILISVKGMIERHCGTEKWKEYEQRLAQVSRYSLVLEMGGIEPLVLTHLQ